MRNDPPGNRVDSTKPDGVSGGRKISAMDRAAALWVARNRGVMSRIAERVGVTPQFVSMVLRGVRGQGGVDRGGVNRTGRVRLPGMKGERVMRELEQMNAPVGKGKGKRAG